MADQSEFTVTGKAGETKPLSSDDLDYYYVQWLCEKGWVEIRDIPSRLVHTAKKLGMTVDECEALYLDRLGIELTMIRDMKMLRYFVVVYDIYRFARSADIMVGPGRGSAAGSLVCYLLTITSIDPLEHGLLFERFMNRDRIDLPDIDMDFEDHRRGEVIQYMVDTYGADKASQITTYSTLKGKACLDDLGRVLDIPRGEIAEAKKAIVERSSGDERASQTVEDGFKEFEAGRDFNTAHPEVLPFVMRLEGQVKHAGIHAAGVVASPIPLTDVLPLETRDDSKNKGERIVCTAFDFWGSEAMGLVKFDVLGLSNLSILRDTLELIEDRHGEKVDLESMDLELPEVLRGFTNGDFDGIFQFDSVGMRHTTEDIAFTSFEDVIAFVALYRPGPMRSGMGTQYVKNKNDRSLIKSLHPLYDKITEPTYGIIVYQEQVSQIFVELAGYNPSSADSLRKAIAKKFGDEQMERERDIFVRGAKERGVEEATANRIMDDITFFGSYGFNKSHAAAYGAISYWEMWMKIKYPIEYMTALLRNKKDATDKRRFVKACFNMGLDVSAPDVSKSAAGFSIGRKPNGKDTVLTGFLDVKGIGDVVAAEIVAKQPFKSWSDFIERIERRKVNIRVIRVLAQAGALVELAPNTKALIDGLEGYLKLAPAKAEQKILEDAPLSPDYDDEQRFLVMSEVCAIPGGKHRIEAYDRVLKGMWVKNWTSIGGGNLWKQRFARIRGIVVDLKYNQIGDFHSGEEPDAETKRKMRWGRRYANINVEDESGEQYRMKLGDHIFDQFRHIIDQGVGVPVCAMVAINRQYKAVSLLHLVDLESVRQKLDAGDDLDGWEKYYVDHPVTAVRSKAPKAKRLSAVYKLKAKKTKKRRWRDEKLPSVRVLAAIIGKREVFDKNGGKMAFVMFGDEHVEAEAIAFASSYEDLEDDLDVGTVVELDMESDGKSFILGGKSAKIKTISAFDSAGSGPTGKD